ncbi:MAG TPA: septum formation initiator family protein [Desulfatiglandales bacterium]|nr:septum formation initiator family protein [Desulfatiglandales bacterium]
MKTFKKNYAVYFLVFSCFAVLLFVWLTFGPHGLLDLSEMQKEKEESVVLIEELKGKNKELTAEIRRLKGDPRYLESVARKQLGLVRENEVVYRFKKDSDDSGEGSDEKGKE